MATIEDIQQLQLEKIKHPTLQQSVTEIMEGYDNAEDTADFITVFQPNIDKAFQLISKLAPQAIATKENGPCPSPEKEKTTEIQSKATGPKKQKDGKSKTKPEAEAKPMLSTKQYKDLKKGIDDKLEECRRMIRVSNKEKRALLPPKRPQSTYEKVQKKILSLGKLIPSNLKDHLEVQRETKKILIKAHKDILSAWRMNSLKKLEKDQRLIRENYQKIEEKITEK